MIIFGRYSDCKENSRHIYPILERHADATIIWQSCWFSSWKHRVSSYSNVLVISGEQWLHKMFDDCSSSSCDGKYDLVILQGISLSQLKKYLNDLSELVNPGKQLIATTYMDGDDLITAYKSIPLDKYRLYNGFYNDAHIGNSDEDLGVIGICLTKLFSLKDIKEGRYIVCNSNANIREMDFPDNHFLRTLYPSQKQYVCLPSELYHAPITVELLSCVYRCNVQDALSLWNDLFSMNIIKEVN